MVSKNKKAIIWDWNGTLLNDVEICIDCMNKLLGARNLSLLDQDAYKDVFTFPVKAYYQKLGFNFTTEEFEKPATEFIDLYYQNLHRADLFKPVNEILSQLKSKGYHQSILSAMEHERLVESLKDKKVFHLFDQVAGIEDHYAHSKLDNGYNLLNKLSFKMEEILIVGDTLHDLEVARKLGVEILLVANGHQSKERLLAETPNVINDFSEIIDFL